MRLLLFLLLFPLIGLSQNYQTIRSDQINYFAKSDLSYVLATKTDSVAVVGNDSIFYPFKTIRENDTATVWECEYVMGASWYGDRVIIKDNGENWFFNRFQDTIVFDTQASLNDTFLITTYYSGEWVKGWVSEHDTMTIFGNLDSVKTVKLFSENSNFFLEDSVFRLSKNSGFVDIYPFYDFPYQPYYCWSCNYNYNSPSTLNPNVDKPMHLVGTEYPRQGISRRTRQEYFDLSIGDTLNKVSGSYYQWPLPNNSPPNVYYIQEYIMNRIDYGLDSVSYEYNKKWSHISNQDSIWGYTIANWVTYNDLAPLWTDKVPEEQYFDSIDVTFGYPAGAHLRYNYLTVHPCGPIIEGYSTYVIGASDSSLVCFNNYSMGTSVYSNYFVEGLAGPYYSNSMYQGTSQYVTYTGVSACGVNWYVGLPESVDPTISLYPNPTTGQFTIDLMNANQGNLMISDMSGKIVRQDQINQEQMVVDVQDLPSGIYLVIVEIDGQRYQKKLIKN